MNPAALKEIVFAMEASVWLIRLCVGEWETDKPSLLNLCRSEVTTRVDYEITFGSHASSASNVYLSSIVTTIVNIMRCT
jgi:hypothetical protein